MAGIENIIVSLNYGNNKIEVGELAISNNNIYFKYYPDFIKYGIGNVLSAISELIDE